MGRACGSSTSDKFWVWKRFLCCWVSHCFFVEGLACILNPGPLSPPTEFALSKNFKSERKWPGVRAVLLFCLGWNDWFDHVSRPPGAVSSHPASLRQPSCFPGWSTLPWGLCPRALSLTSWPSVPASSPGLLKMEPGGLSLWGLQKMLLKPRPPLD